MNRKTKNAAGMGRKTLRRAIGSVAVYTAVAAVGALSGSHALGASTTWDGGSSGGGTAWLTATNWNPDTAIAGSATVTANTDVATFTGAGTGTTIGMNMGTNAGLFYLGEITLDGRTRTINNSSASVDGTLTLNGALDGGNNVFLNNTSSTATPFSLTIADGTKKFNVAFAAAGFINVANAGAATTISSTVLSAAGTLTKSGAGTLTLSGASNNFGVNTLALSGGSTYINNASAATGTIASSITVASGALLGGGGFVKANVTLDGTLTPNLTATPTAATFSIDGGLTLNTGSILNFDISSTTKDKVALTGGLTLPGTANTVTININDLGGGVSPSVIPLFTYNPGSLSGAFNSLHLVGLPSAPAGTSFNLLNQSGQVSLEILLAAANLVWKGQTNNIWDVNTTANWVGGAAGKFNNGDFTTFDDSATGPTLISVAASGVSPASMTFSNSSLSYTIGGPGAITGTGSLLKSGTAMVTLNGANSFSGGSTITAGTLNVGNATALGSGAVALSGAATLQFGAPVTMANAVSIGTGGATIDTNGNAATLSSALTGGGLLTKIGTGVLTLATPAPSFTGGTAITAGTVSVNSVNTNGVTGIGTGIVTVSGTGVFDVNGVKGGFTSAGATGTALVVYLNAGGTLQGRGNAAVLGSGGFQIALAGTMTLAAPNAGDKLFTGNSIRNPSPGGGFTSSAVLQITGAGTVQLGSGGTSQSISGTQFSGSWLVNMDNNTGIFQLGPVVAGGFGELLNALGYQAPTQTGLTAVYGGITRPLTLNSGTLAFGSDTPNYGAGTHPSVISYRSPLTLNGGKLASTGLEIDPASPVNGGAIITSTPVTANLAADITLGAGAAVSVLLYEPAPGTTPAGPAGARSLNIMTDPNALTPGAAVGDPAIPVPTNFTFGAASTLSVVANVIPGGSLNFSRTGGTVTVGTGAAIAIDAAGAVNVGRTLPPGAGMVLTTVPLAIDPFTDSTAVAGDTTKSVAATVNGKLNYAARTSAGADVGIKDYRLSSLSIPTGGAVNLLSNTLLADRTILRTGPVSFAGTGKIDLTNNEAIFATTLTAVRAAVVGGNILTTTAGGVVGSLDLGGGNVEVRYTLSGDTNLDAKVDVADLGNLATNYGATSGKVWEQGDFDYNDTVDVADLGSLATNYGLDLGGGASSDGATLVAQSLATVSAGAAVPEPTSLGLLALGATALLGRRRRNA